MAYNTTINNIQDFLSRFSGLVVMLSENVAFVAALLAIPNIRKEWLIIAHILVCFAKAYYLKGKKTVDQPEDQSKLPVEPEDIDIWKK